MGTSTSKPISLPDLPTELRDIIWRYTVVYDYTLGPFALIKRKLVIPLRHLPATELPILRVCRQIRAECLKIYYSENVFGSRVYDRGKGDVGLFKAWFDHMDDKAKMVRTLRIRNRLNEMHNPFGAPSSQTLPLHRFRVNVELTINIGGKPAEQREAKAAFCTKQAATPSVTYEIIYSGLPVSQLLYAVLDKLAADLQYAVELMLLKGDGQGLDGRGWWNVVKASKFFCSVGELCIESDACFERDEVGDEWREEKMWRYVLRQ